MGEPVALPVTAEPSTWTLVFHRESASRLLGFLAFGRFKHVSAFAWLPELRIWLVYDVQFARTLVLALPDTPQAKAYLGALIRGNAIVTMPRREGLRPWFRFGFFCTTAVKHLVGLRCVAVRPDALYRHCIAMGGKVSDDAGQAADHRPQPDNASIAG